MSLDKNLINNLVNITSSAAIACHKYIGKNDKNIADKAATDAMRKNLNKLNIDGKVVIGEGELDEAPMLYIGEKLGTGKGPIIDIAVDPLEGTNFDATDLDFSIEKNIKNIADSKNKDPSKLNACILDRPRHKDIINKLKDLKVNLKLLTDGDVSGALLVTDKKYNIDIFLGIGGGPEGVLAASALDAFGCKFQGRFLFNNDKDIIRARKMGIKDLNKKYNLNEIVKGDSIFCATGVTSGDLVNGVKLENRKFITETLVTHKNSTIGIVKKVVPIT